MKQLLLFTSLVVLLAVCAVPGASAQVNVYAGYLNNLSGPPIPADIPSPFDPSANTILIGSGDSNSPHDTGVLRFENLCSDSITIDPGINVVTQGGVFQIWDGSLPLVLGPGMNLVLTETANFNFDTSDFGLGANPVVNGSVNRTAFSFTDTARILLGHEEAGNSAETTPYGLLGRIECEVPEPGTYALLGGSIVGLLAPLARRRWSR